MYRTVVLAVSFRRLSKAFVGNTIYTRTRTWAFTDFREFWTWHSPATFHLTISGHVFSARPLNSFLLSHFSVRLLFLAFFSYQFYFPPLSFPFSLDVASPENSGFLTQFSRGDVTSLHAITIAHPTPFGWLLMPIVFLFEAERGRVLFLFDRWLVHSILEKSRVTFVFFFPGLFAASSSSRVGLCVTRWSSLPRHRQRPERERASRTFRVSST